MLSLPQSRRPSPLSHGRQSASKSAVARRSDAGRQNSGRRVRAMPFAAAAATALTGLSVNGAIVVRGATYCTRNVPYSKLSSTEHTCYENALSCVLARPCVMRQGAGADPGRYNATPWTTRPAGGHRVHKWVGGAQLCTSSVTAAIDPAQTGGILVLSVSVDRIRSHRQSWSLDEGHARGRLGSSKARRSQSAGAVFALHTACTWALSCAPPWQARRAAAWRSALLFT